MTTFTQFTDPYISDVGVTSPFASAAAADSSYFDWNGSLDGLLEADISLLLRTVELVVQAQTFSRERLRLALQIRPESATAMTRSLELLGIISAGELNAQRRVFVSVRALPVLLAKMLSGRDRLPRSTSPEELRIAS